MVRSKTMTPRDRKPSRSAERPGAYAMKLLAKSSVPPVALQPWQSDTPPLGSGGMMERADMLLVQAKRQIVARNERIAHLEKLLAAQDDADGADAAAARNVADMAKITSLQRELNSADGVHKVELADVSVRLTRRDKELETTCRRLQQQTIETDHLREQLRRLSAGQHPAEMHPSGAYSIASASNCSGEVEAQLSQQLQELQEQHAEVQRQLHTERAAAAEERQCRSELERKVGLERAASSSERERVAKLESELRHREQLGATECQQAEELEKTNESLQAQVSPQQCTPTSRAQRALIAAATCHCLIKTRCIAQLQVRQLRSQHIAAQAASATNEAALKRTEAEVAAVREQLLKTGALHAECRQVSARARFMCGFLVGVVREQWLTRVVMWCDFVGAVDGTSADC
jgi:hypothetical protein